MDGPVVTAAKAALEKGNVNLILPWAPKKAEEELKKGFERTLRMRKLGKDAKELANYWFFETIVRLHREGEGGRKRSSRIPVTYCRGGSTEKAQARYAFKGLR